jgi:hypothetical protein
MSCVDPIASCECRPTTLLINNKNVMKTHAIQPGTTTVIYNVTLNGISGYINLPHKRVAAGFEMTLLNASSDSNNNLHIQYMGLLELVLRSDSIVYMMFDGSKWVYGDVQATDHLKSCSTKPPKALLDVFNLYFPSNQPNFVTPVYGITQIVFAAHPGSISPYKAPLPELLLNFATNNSKSGHIYWDSVANDPACYSKKGKFTKGFYWWSFYCAVPYLPKSGSDYVWNGSEVAVDDSQGRPPYPALPLPDGYRGLNSLNSNLTYDSIDIFGELTVLSNPYSTDNVPPYDTYNGLPAEYDGTDLGTMYPCTITFATSMIEPLDETIQYSGHIYQGDSNSAGLSIKMLAPL